MLDGKHYGIPFATNCTALFYNKDMFEAAGLDPDSPPTTIDELTEVRKKKIAKLSGGMKHRAALGRTFLAEANLLILDEPFRGLDEELKNRIIERLWEKTTEGKTVLLISHNAEDCNKLSERIVSI